MRLVTTLLLAATLLFLSGCSKASENGAQRSEESRATTTTTTTTPSSSADNSAPSNDADPKMKTISLTEAQASQQSADATARKIIRNAELTLETASPQEGQRKVTAVAEARGGYVVSSEASQRQTDEESKLELAVTVVVRVPVAQFVAALDDIRAIGSHVRYEKSTGQDVTQEYMDLEARIRAKQALEAQFLEIMKQARSVTDALEVQSQLSEVRSEIEQLEGRRRFLENQASMSTIKVTMQPSQPLVNTSGFFYKVKRAFGSGVDIAASITLFLIEFIIAIIPVIVLIFLPIFLLLRYLLRRWRRTRLAQRLAQEAQSVPES
ncbi:MAG: DUF4349 domain-containing protein [Pyrinomonadaceae bacterium]